MNRRVRSPLLLAALSVGPLLLSVACAQPTDEEAGVDTGALSAADCDKKLVNFQADAKAKCVKDNAFDVAACRKPAQAAYDKLLADVTAAESAVRSQLDPFTGACKSEVAKQTCEDILNARGDHYGAAKAAAQGKGDTAMCATVRKEKNAECDRRAASDIAAQLGDNSAYQAALDRAEAGFDPYWAAMNSCWASDMGSSVARASCTPRAAASYQSAYLSCRHECPKVDATACTPAEYKGQTVECGKYAPNSGFFGITCESDKTCERTKVCDEYDQLKFRTAGLSCIGPNGATGAVVPAVTFTTKGTSKFASGTSTTCAVAAAN
jgi:hypothetical protein